MGKYFSAKRERYQETVLNLYSKEGKNSKGKAIKEKQVFWEIPEKDIPLIR